MTPVRRDEKYERSAAATDYIEFGGRPHQMMAAEGWDEVAAAIDSWLDGALEAAETGPQQVSA